MTWQDWLATASAVVLAGMYVQGRRVNQKLRARLVARQAQVRRLTRG